MNNNRNNKTGQKTLESMHAIHDVPLGIGQNEVIALVCPSSCENSNKETINEMALNPQDLKKLIRLSWSGKALERIGNHIKNICGYVTYLVKGKHVRYYDLETIKGECF